ncbi:hypothetical protein N4G69_50815, partial [Streptomyces mirabilis]
MRTVSALTRGSRATATTGDTSGPALANAVRTRKTRARADVVPRVHRSSTARSPADSNTGPARDPVEELKHQQQKSYNNQRSTTGAG